MVVPYLNINDKIALCELEGNDRPCLIVEGVTDYDIYSSILKLSDSDWGKIDFVIGECKSNIIKYHNEGLSFKYLIILDSDHDRVQVKSILVCKFLGYDFVMGQPA